MNKSEVRKLNLLSLMSKEPSRKDYAEKLGYPNTNYLNQVISGHCAIGARTAKRIEEAEGLYDGWLSQPHPDVWRESQSLPVLTEATVRMLSTIELTRALDVISKVLNERMANEAQD